MSKENFADKSLQTVPNTSIMENLVNISLHTQKLTNV